MECPQCKIIDMRVEKVENNVIHYVCKKCGETLDKTIEELEKEDE